MILQYSTTVKKVKFSKTPIMKQVCFAGCAQTLSDATPKIGKIHLFRKTETYLNSYFDVLPASNYEEPVLPQLIGLVDNNIILSQVDNSSSN